MKQNGRHALKRFQKRWQLFALAELLMYAFGLVFLIHSIFRSWWITGVSFLCILFLLLILKNPWRFTAEHVSQFVDKVLKSAENSSTLLLIPEEKLSNLAQLQKAKISDQLASDLNHLQPKVKVKTALLVLVFCTILAGILYTTNIFEKSSISEIKPAGHRTIVFQALDTTKAQLEPPVITKQQLRIDYPSYTKLPSRTTSNMNVKALKGSNIRWNIFFDTPVDSVFLEVDATAYSMPKKNESYTSNRNVFESSFYNFKFKDRTGGEYVSDLYALEVIQDEVPEVEIQNLKQFSTVEIGGDKVLKFNALLSDDFGIANAYIIATVTKGQGESVKFREERLTFDSGFNKGGKKLNLTKTIDLDALKMEPGDELYFYVEGIDVKQPEANRSRSETYFAVIRDTTTYQFAVEGTMGADLMPDYFRSQRQLIIDTEKLIADKNTHKKTVFNSISNELGYDQKALRLKYGEFMGDEADSGIQVTQEIEIEESANENDPLQDYTHDHDGSNEHNLVDHDHDHGHEEEGVVENEETPLDSFLHNHDDPEESTLFSQSLKSKLRQAMAEMWDAELHLRLYTPEKSLPYQYRALKLIQEIKNSARIYVHRIGFDPPPIKEDKRLTGDLEEVKTFQKKEDVALEDSFESIRKSITRITEILAKNSRTNKADKVLFVAAGNELARLAIQNPGKYLGTLQRLKFLSESDQSSVKEMRAIQFGLWEALPALKKSPSKTAIYENDMNSLMLKELEAND